MEEIMAKKKGPDFPSSPIKVTDGNFRDVIEKYPLVVVDCWAEWCLHCKVIGRIIEELAEDFSGEIVFGKLNIDQNPKTPGKFQVSGIPTLLIAKDGGIVDRIVGSAKKPQLEQKLRKYLD
ncbi:hypothetical protein AKJ57_06565 [candidate division MSBL1 archaeon SCGC-AAA259A05]|uniref:Thioredoxin domain-containing protein n=1 Tax=candidate division MSBL1 archaeon SCGC-AAA259A05 TaxID=1698259 RepID=A0A133U375_9EURY|nr:hypothetical protein AKJ57_06565 [candidate division MSBL1 archaeon SCGC-AAA259A05]